MDERAFLPIIGITACLKALEVSSFHSVQDKYVEALLAGTDALPVIIPAIGQHRDVAPILDRLDGLLVTGSPSNVDPLHYSGPPAREGNVADPARDATTLPLIRAAVARGLPLLAICRGIQELNVALGGSLHQHVHEVSGRFDHRSDKTKPYAERYAPRHPIRLTPGGRLSTILGGATQVEVNSLHGQGIDRLAPALVVEALAEDGTIEAVSLAGSSSFTLGVQWHPEWRVTENPISMRLFAAFGVAARNWAARRIAPPLPAVA
jgi:putative glutamine amidotransferase